jgi:putative adhesin
MSRLTALLAAAVLFLPLASLAAQESDEEWLLNCRESRWGDWSSRARHCEIRELGLKATGKPLTVDPSVNGGVEIEAWDTDSIAVTARIQVNARAADEADAIARDIHIDASGATVRATGPGSLGRHQNWSVTFLVLVPRRTDLSLSTENGPLSVKNVSGHMELSTLNGPLSLSGVAGDVHARAENGPLSVRLMGSRWDGVGLDAATMNGPADLRIPDDYNANVEFGTVNGPMEVGFPMTVTLSGRVRNRISTTLGSGGPPVRVVTTNGPMTVRRGSR